MVVETKIHYSRIKRWQNMHGSKCNADGSFKSEYRNRLLADGDSEEDICIYENRFKTELEEWKRLDETDPEPWVNYSAYEAIFTTEDRKKFDEFGSLRPEYLESSLNIGIREGFLRVEETKMKDRIAEYERMSAFWAERGVNFGEDRIKSQQNAARTYPERARQMIQDLRNGEDEDSLPFDPDWFFNVV